MITGLSDAFYPQKNCVFNFFWLNSQNNWSGSFKVKNISNESLDINFISGKIFENNNFIYSIEPKTIVNISGNYSSSYFNIFLNNNFIYSKTGNFSPATGFSFEWNTGYDWDIKSLFPKTFFYGEKPIIDVLYNQSGFYSSPISITLSGDNNNNGPFILRSGEIGRYSNTNADIQSFYFGISGVENWVTGVSIDKNELFNFNIYQKQTSLPFVNAYIPLILYTNAGIIGKSLYISRYPIPVGQNLFLNINPSLSRSNINNFLRSSFIIDITIQNPQQETTEALFILTGYEGNNINKDGYEDIFSDSWSVIIDGQNIPLSNISQPVTGFISGYLSGGNFYAFNQNDYPNELSGFSGVYVQDEVTQTLYFPSGESFSGFNSFIGTYFNSRSGFNYSGFASGFAEYGSGFYPTQGALTGSMTGIVGSRNIGGFFSGKFNINTNIFEQNKKIEVYKQIEQANGNIGFTGSSYYIISGNNFYKTGILGSYKNIFREYYSYTL